MRTRFFIGNVAYALTEQELADELSQVFNPSLGIAFENVRIIKDKETGNPRGFGFVEVALGGVPPEIIVEGLNAVYVGGRPLRVAVADKQPLAAAPRRSPKPKRQGKQRRRGREEAFDEGFDGFPRRRRAW